jgi:colicin import membrane protein
VSSRKPAPRANLERPPQPGRVRSVILAIVVHAVFFAFIVFGVNWQTRETAPYEAQLWEKLPSAPPKEAAPRPEPPKPEPEPPKPVPEPPKPPPEPPKPPPKPPEEKPEPPKPDPEIALKAEREKKEQEKRARLEKAEREKKEKEKAEREKQRKEEVQKKREEEARKKEEQQAFEAAQKQRAAAAAQRQQEFNEWVGKIRDKIRGKANVPDTVTGRPEVVVHIRILPGGEVFEVAIVKSSGNPTYDAAIERAVRSSSPLPVPAANTELFSQFRDLNLNIKHDR